MVFRLLQCATAFLLLMGLGMLFSSTTQVYRAQLAGQGSTTLEPPVFEWAIGEGEYHLAAFGEEEGLSSGAQLLLGILLILLGFSIHTFVVLRTGKNEGMGRLLVARNKGMKKQGVYRYTEWLWIEVK